MVNREYFSSIENRMHEYQVDHRITRKKTGEIRYVNEKCEHITDSHGRIVRSLGMIHDITRRKTIEEALKKSEEQFRSLVYNSSELMVLMDLEGITIYISPQCQQITGYPEYHFICVGQYTHGA
jgi:PAS domain-containing protein